jgi:CRISPR-associated protein Csx10
VWRLLQQQPLHNLRTCEASGKVESDSYCGQYATDAYEVCPVCRIFGSPRMKKHWRIESARPVDAVETQRVMRVRVNPRTRRAAPNKLFAQEQGGTGVFEFEAVCPTSDEAALDEAAMLVAAARFVRHLGRSRRRGQGECLLTLAKVEGTSKELDQQAFLDRFKAAWIEGEPHAPSATDTLAETLSPDSAGDGTGVRYRLWARLEEPVIIAERATAGNQFEGQSVIPGKTLRGAMAAHAARYFDLEDPSTYEVFVDLFLRGAVTFPTLTIATQGEGDGYRPTLPVPADAFACKVYRDHPIQWGTLSEEHPHLCNHSREGADGPCQNAVKRKRDRWVPLQANEVSLLKPAQVSEMHIQIDPETQRVREGQLYEYRGLRAGQVFMGELACENEDAWEQLKTLTGLREDGVTPVHLGKGTQRGYGEVSLWVEPLAEKAPALAVGQPFSDRLAVGAETLTLTLLSDAVVTDTWGRFATGFENDWLKQALKLDVAVIESRVFAGSRILDGFNTKRRLPRWRDLALTAGSTVRLRLAQPLTADQHKTLKKLEKKGIGLRRNEGYGCIAFNHPVYSSFAELDESSTALRPPWGSGDEEHERAERSPLDTWRGKLQSANWAGCQSKEWRALARWLHAHAGDPLDSLIASLDTMSELDAGLVTLMGGPAERGDREVHTRFEGENCLGVVETLVRKLADQKPDDAADGVRMLAERLAAEAGKEEGSQ